MPLLQTAVCGRCEPRTELIVAGRLLACPKCGDPLGGRIAPTCVVVGPSGSGKTVAARGLRRLAADEQALIAVLDGDTLLHRLPDDTCACLNDWLLLAAAIGAGGVAPVLLLPADRRQIEAQPGYAQLPEVRWAVLACPSRERLARLRARPAWRRWDDTRPDFRSS